MEGRGRDPGRQDRPPKTHATRLQGIKRLLHTRLLSLRAQPPYHSPQHEAHLEMTRLAPQTASFVGFMPCFFISQKSYWDVLPDPSPDLDLERGGRIAGSQRYTPEKTVHRSRRDEHPQLFPLLWPVRSTPPRPDPRMVQGTVRTSPHPQRHLDGPAVATGGQTPTHAQHHKVLLKIVTKRRCCLFAVTLSLSFFSHRILLLGLDALRGQRTRLVLKGGGRTQETHDTPSKRLGPPF